MLDLRQILFCQSIGIIRRAYYRFHGQLIKPQVRHVENILCKIYIVVGECAAHVIILTAACFHQLPELRHDNVIAASAVCGPAQSVMDFPASVQAEHHIMHFSVGKLYHIIVYPDTVSGKREAEILSGFFFYLPAIFNYTLYHIPVHQRLSSEEVHLQIHSVAGIFHEKIKSPLSRFQAHKSPLAMEFPLACKAVVAAEITGMSYMEAKSLDLRVSVLQVESPGLIYVFSEQFAILLQLVDVVEDFFHIRLCHIIFSHDSGSRLLPG